MAKQKFFICKSCGLEQNLDQSVNIKQKYCVSCYNKEQIHREMITKMEKHIKYLLNMHINFLINI